MINNEPKTTRGETSPIEKPLHRCSKGQGAYLIYTLNFAVKLRPGF